MKGESASALISCITPTTSARRAFLPRAIDYFLRQDYPNKELLVVDDGPEPVADLVPVDDPRIRYVRLNGQRSLGAKRNECVRLARGEIIAHWDDDDWHSPRRLSYQVRALLESGREVCGISTLLFYDVRAQCAWKFIYPPQRRPQWLAGSTLVYRRRFWETHPFPDINVGEDARFVWSAAGAPLLELPDHAFHVGIIHGGNVSPKHTAGAWWQPGEVSEIRRMIGDEDWHFYGEWGNTPRNISSTANVPPIAPLRNVFACLVHERPECVADLVRNLHALDPDSSILLYNGGNDLGLLKHFPFERYSALIHPTPRPMKWGWLHDFAIDSMRFAMKELPFETMTIVDSDQLALRPGYSRWLGAHLPTSNARLGMLGNSAQVQRRDTRIPPAVTAWREFELWSPLLRRFPGGEEKWVHWSFWPSTVFTAAAAADLVAFFDADTQLREILSRTKIWASEEIILPTLTALLGYEIAKNPCTDEFVKHRAAYTPAQIDRAMARDNVLWVHPVPRGYEDPIRARVRDRSAHYRKPPGTDMIANTSSMEQRSSDSLLLMIPLLARMRKIDGWLEDAEADLLAAATSMAAREHLEGSFVEVGSFCGRSTVVIAAALSAYAPGRKLHAIDPHEGVIGAAGRYVSAGRTLEKLRRNLTDAGVANSVEVVQARSTDVAWDSPLALLWIDGLHDYPSVAADFYHFEPHLLPGGYAAFHDYWHHYPGVMTFVDELLQSRRYARVEQAGCLILLQKLSM